MGQEFFINSQELENKIRQLLPSQGGAGAGFDLSASTQIVPIIDLTESAEGSNVRQDLQTAQSLTSTTPFFSIDETETIIANTGYFRVSGFMSIGKTDTAVSLQLAITDGTTTKILKILRSIVGSNATYITEPFDFVVFVEAGETVTSSSSNAFGILDGTTRQIASLDGTLTNP